MSSATSESSTDPSTSALGPGGNSDERIDSQEARNTPQTSGTSKTTSKKDTNQRKTTKQPAKKVTAR